VRVCRRRLYVCVLAKLALIRNSWQRDPRFPASGAALPGFAGRNPSGIPVPVVCDHSGVVSSGFPAPQTRGGRPAPLGDGRAWPAGPAKLFSDQG
jgi:hypothetical protein